MAAIDSVGRPSAVYTSDFGREDSGKEKELIGNPEIVYQGG